MIVFVLVGVAYLTILERKVLRHIQFRKGPNKVGFLGLSQPDGLKLLSKIRKGISVIGDSVCLSVSRKQKNPFVRVSQTGFEQLDRRTHVRFELSFPPRMKPKRRVFQDTFIIAEPLLKRARS